MAMYYRALSWISFARLVAVGWNCDFLAHIYFHYDHVGGMCLFDNVINRFFDWMFPNGIKPAKNPPANERKPLARLLSLPCGIVLGVFLAELGLSDTLLFFT